MSSHNPNAISYFFKSILSNDLNTLNVYLHVALKLSAKQNLKFTSADLICIIFPPLFLPG